MRPTQQKAPTPWRSRIIPVLMFATGTYFLYAYLRVHGLSGLLAL